jgi:hypothetical protein
MIGIVTFIFSALLILSCPREAHAYIDPGTGSYILQLLAAGVLAALFMLKVFWAKVKHFFAGFFVKTPKRNSVDDN